MKHERSALFLHIAVVGRAAVARVMEATVFCEGLASGRMSEGTWVTPFGAATSERKILLPTLPVFAIGFALQRETRAKLGQTRCCMLAAT